MKFARIGKICMICVGLCFTVKSATAQQSAEELAKKLANPIASLISVPFQNNTDYGIGDNNGTRNTMNIQPVIPMGLSKDLNLIGRWVQPWVTQYDITGEGQKQNGLADAVVSAFVSPKISKNGFTWGAGPVFQVPVATHELFATKQFGVGPTVVALKQSKGWTLGLLANQIWGITGGEGRPKVNQMFIQPFCIYNWKSGAGFGGNMELTQNWTSDKTTLWLNPSFAGITSLGKQKTQLVFGPRFNLAAPKGAKADWGWRGAVVFLFPK